MRSLLVKSTVTTSVTTVTCDWCYTALLLEEAKAHDWKTITVFEREIDEDEPSDETGAVLHLCNGCRPHFKKP